ncbi:MAG: serine/threonine protein kinase [Cyanobacteriota bacterium]|nr:serine/threonine protein kinase [Cyanobacteriota bacterium]
MGPTLSAGQLIGGRYRLESPLSEGGAQGDLWQARDTLAADAPAAVRRLGPGSHQQQARQLWARLQGVLHPQVPRAGAVISEGEDLWLVREWQAGRTYQELLATRQERQLVFGAGEVLLLLRQLLPVLVALHSQDLFHGDLTPANLLRRDRDGQPVLLDFGLLGGAEGGLVGATPGYAPPELLQGASPQPWMDLHALGVTALVLLSGDGPERLLDPQTLERRWPSALDAEPAFRQQLARMVSPDPAQRFASAVEALMALQELPMPETTGPVPRADRTVVLVPTSAPPPPSEVRSEAQPVVPTPPSELARVPDHGGEAETDLEVTDLEPEAPMPPQQPSRRRHSAPPTPARARKMEREEQAEGGLWPVLLALIVSAVAGTALGWWWLSRGGGAPPSPTGTPSVTESAPSLPPGEVDQREQLMSRLRALQIDRGWFLDLVNASLLAQYPERRGRLPSDSLEDAPLRKAWSGLAEDWLARVEQLPMVLRRRLGSFTGSDWDQRQKSLSQQGLSSEVLQQLISGSAQNLLPGRSSGGIPEEPYRQLWYAAAIQILENLSIEPIEARPQLTQLLAADVPANGARLFPIRLPQGHALVLGVNGTPLLQMSVFAADGRSLAPRGPLRVVNLGVQDRSPVQLLVTNEGVAPSRISLSLRADPTVVEPTTPKVPEKNTLTPQEPKAPGNPQPNPLSPDEASPSPAQTEEAPAPATPPQEPSAPNVPSPPTPPPVP